MPRPYFCKKRQVSEIIRVDHAGEYGAIRIYQGQIAATKDESYKSLFQEMLSHEQKHLDYFAEEIGKSHSRPTILLPFWHVLGYMMGYISAAAGVKTAMLCTEAVEEVIDEHYKNQQPILSDIGMDKLAEQIEQHRQDELNHKNIAIKHGSTEAPMYLALKIIISKLCNFAIFSSKIL